MIKPLLLSISFALPLSVLAQQKPDSTARNSGYRLAAGILATYQAVGVQAELRFSSRFALKAVGARSLDYVRREEHGGAGIGLLTYYLPSRHPFLEPLVGVGGVYSWYHWNLLGGSGTLHDLNVGGAFGTNFCFSRRFRAGVNVFLANGFRAEYREGTMSIVGRRLLAMPTLTLDVLL
ncbi:hypothetical protein [Hymenobacter weizhouensis]|uniref:hypothetical protein n=1 Tax=Hymenobacter sp. YIM 151500-1 TaxID=2987689 RepID=UPI0022279192|nr:hypothetical protein [Hymenobacter sp. YIM 151500-1]UYZ65160.1 hypothetical protein OIS53_09990 [Hymenobacter sp. YIM 151500-1]